MLQSAPPTPSLVFSEKFDERSEKDQITYLKKLCSSQNQALDQMQKDRNHWRAEAQRLEAAVKNAEDAFYIQKDIVANLITQDNEEKQGVAKRIQELEAQVTSQDRTIKALNGNLN